MSRLEDPLMVFQTSIVYSYYSIGNHTQGGSNQIINC
jgi:hypothetical protein